MLNNKQFREEILLPTLSILQKYSDDAVELLVFTCAVETDGGSFVKQIKGPGLGIYSCEPATHTDIWNNYLRHRPNLINILAINFSVNPNTQLLDRLVYDLAYATAIARIHYLRVNEPLPDRNDPEAIWEYYKKYYNSCKGKSTKEKSIKKYEAFCK